ncbi:MAG TPA: nitroreductase family protein [Candidatus Hydrogenedentes bacterium]|nr:nitroreductase family protein [Candidatus Hydrogenedentota bacterium]
MSKITIDATTCTRCGRCVAECPAVVLEQSFPKQPPEAVREAFCIACGHCVAICPVDALHHTAFPESTVHAVAEDLLPTSEQLLELMRARRSIRVFHERPVERELVEQVIEAARLAPTAHNSQSTRYTVVQDPVQLKQVADLTADYFDKLARQLRNPVSRRLLSLIAPKQIKGALQMLPELEAFLAAIRGGMELILHGAPCLILFHAAPGGHFPAANANLAIQNATLMAQALGLGSFWTGFVVAACTRDRRIASLLDVPPGQVIFGGMVLGYPKFEYKKWIDRDPARVNWI